MKKAKAKKAKNAKKHRGIKAKAKLAKEAKAKKAHERFRVWVAQTLMRKKIIKSFLRLCTLEIGKTTTKMFSYLDPTGAQLSDDDGELIWDICTIFANEIIGNDPRRYLDSNDPNYLKFSDAAHTIFWDFMPHEASCICKRCSFIETFPDGTRLGICSDGSKYEPVTIDEFRDLAREYGVILR